MERIDEQLDEIIEKLQDYILTLDPGSKEYGQSMGRLDAMMRQRETHIKNESDAVKFDTQNEFEKEKLDREMKLGKRKILADMVGHGAKIGSTIITAGCVLAATFKGYQLEYDQHNPMNIPSKIWNGIPKFKF